ncbi:Leucine-rich repeat-containing protein [Artemisia annua]|uniref:Leucine-rich repeat-containing protein n=1 Tax=Artemisia annua TaxID=35608 RepID=A0A2U1PCH4_ARTAN|nr:Leucine-rich repeat-containing protein [Artemisia annua]
MSGYDLNSASDHWLQVINTLPSLVELHLISCNLSQIPQHLSNTNLTSLTNLDLSYNIFNSSMPRWIFSLSKLVYLDLTSCLFHGPDLVDRVSGFHNLTNLKVLHVPGNDFMNSTLVLRGLLSLTSLEVLDVNTCNIAEPILSDLSNMTSLVYIDLSQNQILETLPNSFQNLCNLTFIDIRDNFYSGNVSDFLNNLCECKSPKLQYLAFSANRLFGHIPDRIGQLQNLVTFDLAFNKRISGTIPESLGRLSSLEDLRLNVNLLSGRLPDSLGNLTSLKSLEISFNNLSGTLPQSLGKLGNLNFLSVHHNSLSGLVTEDHFANLTALDTIRAEGNTLTLKLSDNSWVPPFQVGILSIGSWNLGPHFPSWIQSQTNLWDLDIANALISDTMPSWFSSTFSNIDYLNVSFNRIQGFLFQNVSFLAPKAVLDLSDNDFEGPIPETFNEAEFAVLDISSNRLSGNPDPFLCPSLEKSRSLKVLDLSNNNLSGVIPDCWLNWPNLSVISFQNNNFSGEIPQSVMELPSLESFNIRNNSLSGEIPASLLNLKSLQILELAENDFYGRIPMLIGREETNLKLLSLRSNKLDGEIPVELCRLTSIQILDLAHNNLSGTLPTCFYNFSSMFEKRELSPFVLYDVPFQVKVLGSASLVAKGRELKYTSILYLVTTLDLSGNKLYGSIPKELMGLLGLRWMNLSGNHLTGKIPEEIGEMTLLESLDLSVNEINGRIPWSISRLSLLSSLNLSFNKLTGQTPTGTQLQTFNESSFTGNLLCGPPLSELCENKGISPDANTGSEKDQNYDESDVNWGFVISVVLGYIISFWAVIVPLIASKEWRNKYFNFLYKMWFKVRNTICK